ncbi:MAG: hypothetical protein KKF68_01820 [Nanoarchaeota archaeon]|nr:hypothetical protein [Nanoarchaeota archaeon]
MGIENLEKTQELSEYLTLLGRIVNGTYVNFRKINPIREAVEGNQDGLNLKEDPIWKLITIAEEYENRILMMRTMGGVPTQRNSSEGEGRARAIARIVLKEFVNTYRED